MISKKELLNQKTKRDTNKEELEKIIDNNLRKIYPDCIKNREIKFETITIDSSCDEKLIEEVLNKYIKQGGYSAFEYNIRQVGIFYMYVDIILKL